MTRSSARRTAQRSSATRNVLTDGDLSACELDWRKRYRGKALAVVRPGIDRRGRRGRAQPARAHGAALVPQGGNTGLVGGSVPDASGTQVLLSLTRHEPRARASTPPT